MQIEILALRHQLAVLQERTQKRASLRVADRFFWVILSRLWTQWRSALVIVKPETVILRGTEKGFDYIGAGRAGQGSAVGLASVAKHES